MAWFWLKIRQTSAPQPLVIEYSPTPGHGGEAPEGSLIPPAAPPYLCARRGRCQELCPRLSACGTLRCRDAIPSVLVPMLVAVRQGASPERHARADDRVDGAGVHKVRVAARDLADARVTPLTGRVALVAWRSYLKRFAGLSGFEQTAALIALYVPRQLTSKPSARCSRTTAQKTTTELPATAAATWPGRGLSDQGPLQNTADSELWLLSRVANDQIPAGSSTSWMRALPGAQLIATR
jgi:hypothetical protein